MIRGFLSWFIYSIIAISLTEILITLFIINNLGVYFTNENKKWFLGIVLPAIITLGGWIYIFISSRLHMKKEKQISIKISTYNFIKDSTHRVIESFNNFNVYTSHLIKSFKEYLPELKWNNIDKKYFVASIFNCIT